MYPSNVPVIGKDSSIAGFSSFFLTGIKWERDYAEGKGNCYVREHGA